MKTRMDMRAISEGESRRLGDRMIVAHTKGNDERDEPGCRYHEFEVPGGFGSRDSHQYIVCNMEPKIVLAT